MGSQNLSSGFYLKSEPSIQELRRWRRREVEWKAVPNVSKSGWDFPRLLLQLFANQGFVQKLGQVALPPSPKDKFLLPESSLRSTLYLQRASNVDGENFSLVQICLIQPLCLSFPDRSPRTDRRLGLPRWGCWRPPWRSRQSGTRRSRRRLRRRRGPSGGASLSSAAAGCEWPENYNRNRI